MFRSTPAEWLLALFSDRDRAVAIFGDLAEMGESHGRLWFVAAYLRTLFSLTWRIVLALVAAVLCRQFIFDVFHFYLRHTPIAWRSTSSLYFNLLNTSGPLMATILSNLWFALPFSAIRYGVRDRFVRLTFVFSIGTTVAFLFVPGASAIFAAGILILASAAIVSRGWRKPFAVLAGTLVAGGLSLAVWGAFRAHVPWSAAAHSPLTKLASMGGFQLALLAIAVTCSALHRLLDEHDSKPAGTF